MGAAFLIGKSTLGFIYKPISHSISRLHSHKHPVSLHKLYWDAQLQTRKDIWTIVVYGRQTEVNVIDRIRWIIKDTINSNGKLSAFFDSRMFGFGYSIYKNFGRNFFSVNNKKWYRFYKVRIQYTTEVQRLVRRPTIDEGFGVIYRCRKTSKVW